MRLFYSPAQKRIGRADKIRMTDRVIERLEFQRDLLSLSGLAREVRHPETKNIDKLVNECRQAFRPADVHLQDR